MIKNSRIKPIERITNRTWDEWVKFMESINAKSLNHHEITLKVFEELKGTDIDNLGWWAQAVTVTYEQHIGRRMPGQRSDGTFEASVSKSTKRSMKDLMDTWIDFAAKDKEVLGLITGNVRVSGTDKRITWRTKGADGISIMITSEPKANGTAAIIATLTGLQSNELNLEAKAKWSTILGRFLETL